MRSSWELSSVTTIKFSSQLVEPHGSKLVTHNYICCPLKTQTGVFGSDYDHSIVMICFQEVSAPPPPMSSAESADDGMGKPRRPPRTAGKDLVVGKFVTTPCDVGVSYNVGGI